MKQQIESLAAEYNLPVDAVQALWVALQRGNGTAAQFNHPALGGSGQWMPGMVMLGDMNNYKLKAAVDAICSELSSSARPKDSDYWWDTSLGGPSLSGAQNDLRYAYFPQYNLLVVRYKGRVIEYDTSGLNVLGISVQNQSLMISTPVGVKRVSELPILQDSDKA